MDTGTRARLRHVGLALVVVGLIAGIGMLVQANRLTDEQDVEELLSAMMLDSGDAYGAALNEEDAADLESAARTLKVAGWLALAVGLSAGLGLAYVAGAPRSDNGGPMRGNGATDEL